ncbi:MAG: hypothetical protein AAB802_03185 [Patescibacteria group bacterium]
MATTEELLLELIALQKEEMRRNRLERRLHFYLSTMPTLLIVAISIISLWGLYAAVQAMLENFSELDSGSLLQYFQ